MSVPKMSYFAFKSSKVVSIWGLRSQNPGGWELRPQIPIASGGRRLRPGSPLLKFLDLPLILTFLN